ncbi:MAG TPA: beta-ketoacyl-ACP synthase III [Clostridia bacterium]|nr:beta-ketoacyl-ACP synthase III [Clostridia bacterium]
MSFTILGTGRQAPEFVLDNARLTEMMDTSDEWIVTRTGIRQRHICTAESLEDLASKAGLAALEMAGLDPAEVDLILCATMQGDYITPSLACMVQKRIGAACPAMDLNAACSGFIYALDVAAGYYARGTVKHVLVIAAERMSKYLDWEDRSTCVLFGDGAGAVVLGPGDGLLATYLSAEGNEAFLNIPGTPGGFPGASPTPSRQRLFMNGPEVYRFAVLALCSSLETVMKRARVTMDRIRYVVAHQANRRILEAAQARLSIAAEKMVWGVDRYGNTSCASIPLLLDEICRAKALRKGDLLLLSAFGGGLTAGAALIQWG